MSERRFNNSLLREQKVIIPNRFLNDQLKEKIAWANRYRTARMVVFPTGMGMGEILRRAIYGGKVGSWSAFAAGSLLGLAVVNKSYAERVQTMYREMNFSQPLFSVRHEREFPEGWMSAGVIKETHPIYYVDFKGNFVFVKSSRAEYYRYLYQKSILGKLGYHTWWLRGYLEPPKVPESAKKWATAKLRRTIEKMRERKKPSPAPKPAMVPIRTQTNRTKTILPRRTRRR